jgi:hypothetical protein
MTAVLCNKYSPFPPSSCSVRRRRAAVARRPSPPALSSRPPVRPAGNTVLPEYIVSSQQTTTLTCPTNDKKAPTPTPDHRCRRVSAQQNSLCRRLFSRLYIFFSRLYTCLVHDHDGLIQPRGPGRRPTANPANINHAAQSKS